jgi:hypothetical protein
VQREDYEYRRCGSVSLFGAFQPLTGWCTVQVRSRRTAQDFAHFVQSLVEVHFPAAETIQLVLDNLNTHTIAAFYQTFPPAEARRLVSKLAWHYTPPHGSWLNMIEIEWSVLAQQCLGGRRLADLTTVQAEVDAWAQRRNAERAMVAWRFSSVHARDVLAPLYPLLPTHDLNA